MCCYLSFPFTSASCVAVLWALVKCGQQTVSEDSGMKFGEGYGNYSLVECDVAHVCK